MSPSNFDLPRPPTRAAGEPCPRSVLAIGAMRWSEAGQAPLRLDPHDARERLQGALADGIHHWVHHSQANEMMFVMNAPSVAEAAAMLEALPEHLAATMTFDLVPLGPAAGHC